MRPAVHALARTLDPRRHGVRVPLVAYVVPALALVRRRRQLGLPLPVSAAVAASVPPAVAAAAPRSRARHVVTWMAQMWAYKVSFEMPYDRPAKLRARLRLTLGPRADAVLGAGVAPTQRLQRRLRSAQSVNAFDRAVALLYFTWEAEPHIVLGWILARHPERFPRAAAMLGAAFDLTLAGYWLVPAAPPWYASEHAGLLGGEVRRVPTRVVRDFRGEPLEQADVEGSNPWASMPSDHFGTAVMAALLATEANPRAGAAAGAYALALGFALVYLGEHYVVDLLAALALDALILRSEPALRPLARRVDAAWRRIEPSRPPRRRLALAAIRRWSSSSVRAARTLAR